MLPSLAHKSLHNCILERFFFMVGIADHLYKFEPRKPMFSNIGMIGAQCLPLVPIREAYVFEKDGVG